MIRSRSRDGKSPPRPVLVLSLLLVPALATQADEIMLRGGGTIQGKIVDDPKSPQSVQVFLLQGRKPLTLQKRQILEVVPRPSALDEYVTRRAGLASDSSAQAEHELGLWCEAHRLPDLARVHFEGAVARDSAFEPSHRKLGHVLHDGHWLTRDQVRQGQGLVKVNGRWITAEEKSRRDESAKSSATQAGWVRRIRLLRQAVLTAPNDRRREAERELMQIEEPEAVGPLVKVMGNDPTPMRLLLVQALGKIEGKESSRALVHVLLAEPEDEVRTAALERLREREEPEISKQLVASLRSRDIRVLNRAAWALGQLEEVLAVPRLVEALESTEERLILVSQEGEAATAGAGGLPGPALMGMNGSHAAFLTGPAMAPGVVAFGATTVPMFGTVPLPGGNYYGLGVGATPNRGPQPRYVNYVYQNVEVRGALQKLTGQDFGYDEAAWRHWIKTSFNPNPKPARQAAQP